MQLAIKLARVEGDNVNVIRSLTDGEVQEIRNCTKEMLDFNKHFKLIEYVLHNHFCLKIGIESALLKFANNSAAVSRHDLDSIGHEVNINLLNLMMSARTFLDHMETFIKREYGKKSGQSELFKELKSEEFDGKFSYRFMYKLRNYVQHCGMPPLSYSKIKNIEGNSHFFGMTVVFDRDALISSFDDWGTLVKSEIKLKDEKFEAFEIIEEFIKSILRIYIRFNDETRFQRTITARARLATILNQGEAYYEDDYCLFRLAGEDGGRVNFNMSWIPASLFKKVEHYLLLRDEI